MLYQLPGTPVAMEQLFEAIAKYDKKTKVLLHPHHPALKEFPVIGINSSYLFYISEYLNRSFALSVRYSKNPFRQIAPQKEPSPEKGRLLCI